MKNVCLIVEYFYYDRGNLVYFRLIYSNVHVHFSVIYNVRNVNRRKMHVKINIKKV